MSIAPREPITGRPAKLRSLWLPTLVVMLLVAGVLGGLLVGLPGGVPTPATAQDEAQAPVWVTTVEGAVVPPLAAFLMRTIEKAEDAGAEALVIQLDTPGGLDASMREIIQAQIETPMPVVIFVFPQGARSASAGVYMMMGADVAAMAPQTNLGSATPVSLTGEMDEAMQKKVVNDAAAYIRGLASEHGRNTEWPEEAVREAVSLTAEEALEMGVIEFVAADLEDLLQQMDGFTTTSKGVTLSTADAPVVEVSMSWRERLLHTLVDPNIIFILMALGVYGIIFEFQNPGLGVPGIAGAIALLLAAYGLQLLPVSYVGLLLLAVAVILYVAEVKVQSGGIMALGGTVALVLGGLLLFNVPGSVFRVNWTVIAIVALVTLAFFAFVVKAVAAAHQRRPASGSEGMVGETGTARTRLAPAGSIAIHGEIWQADAVGDPIEAGTRIEVVGASGLRLRVHRWEEPPDQSAPSPSDATEDHGLSGS
ncbi:MAG: nodulation protein NfeD [Actinobacteria bacterium]|nr:nodulation protein NfeD [Actinomycetota bacterium]